MKRKILVLFSFLVSITYNIQAQVNGAILQGYNVTASGQYSSAIGNQTIATGLGSFAAGRESSAIKNYAIALGEYCHAQGHYSTALGNASIASADYSISFGTNTIAAGVRSMSLGYFVKTTNTNAIAMGSGYLSTELTNSIANSLMVGFNSTAPTLFVGPNTTASSTGTGNVGIATTTPGSKLQINGNAAIGYSSSTAAPANGLLINGNLGIGTTAATTTEKLTVDSNIALVSSDNGIILKSPDGSNWKLTVDNSGNIITTKITAVNEISPNISNVEIYPNPAKDEVQIKLNNTFAALSIAVELRTMENMLMYYQVFNQKEIVINIQSFTAGSYVVLIKDNNGKVLKNSVLIKQ